MPELVTGLAFDDLPVQTDLAEQGSNGGSRRPQRASPTAVSIFRPWAAGSGLH